MAAPETPLTRQLMNLYLHNMESRRPDPITQADADAAWEPCSLVPAGADNGFIVRFVDGTGRHRDIMLNPVLAQRLAACIGDMGRKSGWLTPEGALDPPASLDS